MNKKRLKKCFCKYRLRTKLQSTYHRICQRLYPNSSDKPKDPWYQSHCMLICSILPKANHILTLFSVIGSSHCKISTIYPEIGKHKETSPRKHILSSFFLFLSAQLRKGKKEQQTKHKTQRASIFLGNQKILSTFFILLCILYTNLIRLLKHARKNIDKKASKRKENKMQITQKKCEINMQTEKLNDFFIQIWSHKAGSWSRWVCRNTRFGIHNVIPN